MLLVVKVFLVWVLISLKRLILSQRRILKNFKEKFDRCKTSSEVFLSETHIHILMTQLPACSPSSSYPWCFVKSWRLFVSRCLSSSPRFSLAVAPFSRRSLLIFAALLSINTSVSQDTDAFRWFRHFPSFHLWPRSFSSHLRRFTAFFFLSFRG